MKKIFISLLVLTAFLLPTATALGAGGGACTSETGIRQYNFKCVVSFAVSVINDLVFVLIGIGFLVFIWGLIKYISAGGDEAKVKEARQYIVFGLIAFFVMMSVWGITSILVHTFFPQGSLLIPQLK